MQINSPKIAALVFDMDGLIFDSERIVQHSWTMASKELGLPDVGAHIYNTLGFNVSRREEYFRKTFGSTFPSNDFRVLARKYYHEYADKNGIPLKPGVIELLMHAKKAGIKTAVATSSRRAHAIHTLSNAMIYQFFDGAVFGDEVKQAKPDPEICITACEILKVNPTESIALEDAPAGIQSAYGAGMLPIMIPDLIQPDEETLSLCCHCLGSLHEVINLLNDLCFSEIPAESKHNIT